MQEQFESSFDKVDSINRVTKEADLASIVRAVGTVHDHSDIDFAIDDYSLYSSGVKRKFNSNKPCRLQK